MFCKYCGATIADDSIFCSKCGKKLNDSNPLPKKKTESKVFSFPERSTLQDNLNEINKWLFHNPIAITRISLNPSLIRHGFIIKYEMGFTRMEIQYVPIEKDMYLRFFCFQESNDSFRQNAENKVYNMYDEWKKRNPDAKEIWKNFLSGRHGEFFKQCTLLVPMGKNSQLQK